MLQVTNLSYGFPQKDLYDKVSFTIEDGTHAVLIGTNGTGKSTLIQLIMDRKEALYDGKIEVEEPCTIGYVSQFQNHDHNNEAKVFDYIMEPFVAQQKKVDDICKEMESGENMEELMDKYQIAWDEYTAMDCDNAEVNIKKELKLAGISHTEDLTIGQISGGEFKLVQIIRQMLVAPNLLIMDEPDAFLDFKNLFGLKALINNHKGTLLVITHNRVLLTGCFDKILHLENMELEEFDGGYKEYRLLTLQTKIEQQASLATEMEEIERNRKVVERMRNRATKVINATYGRALHARVSYLKRLEERKTKSPFVDVPQPMIDLHVRPLEEIAEIGEEEVLLSLPEFKVGYEEDLLSGDGFEVKKHSKIAFVGANGTGKTTMLRAIAEVARQSGVMTQAGDNAIAQVALSGLYISEKSKIAYLSQMQGETLDEELTLRQCLDQYGIEKEEECMALLRQYTLAEEQINQRIGQLSGGEKNLFQLLLLSISDTNFLLLDEPTSHLDVYAQEALEKALMNYEGAILMVCHDFYTIANVADYVLYVEDGKLNGIVGRTFRKKMYAGTFDVKELEAEQKRRQLEQRVEDLLIKNNFDDARKVAEDMEELI